MTPLPKVRGGFLHEKGMVCYMRRKKVATEMACGMETTLSFLKICLRYPFSVSMDTFIISAICAAVFPWQESKRIIRSFAFLEIIFKASHDQENGSLCLPFQNK